MDYYLVTYRRREDALGDLIRGDCVKTGPTYSFIVAVPDTSIDQLCRNLAPWFQALAVPPENLLLTCALNLRFSGVTTASQASRFLEQRLGQ